MVEKLNHKLRENIDEARAQLFGRAATYSREGLKNLELMNSRGKELFLEWVGAQTRKIEHQTDRVFSTLNRPIGWMSSLVDRLDEKSIQYRTQGASSSQETEQEIEVERMIDEGGPVIEIRKVG